MKNMFEEAFSAAFEAMTWIKDTSFSRNYMKKIIKHFHDLKDEMLEIIINFEEKHKHKCNNFNNETYECCGDA